MNLTRLFHRKPTPHVLRQNTKMSLATGANCGHPYGLFTSITPPLWRYGKNKSSSAKSPPNSNVNYQIPSAEEANEISQANTGQNEELGSKTCQTCGEAFEELADQRQHFKLDWHRWVEPFTIIIEPLEFSGQMQGLLTDSWFLHFTGLMSSRS